MQVKVLAFAHTRAQLGWDERTIESRAGETPRALLARLAPAFSPAGLRVAVDGEYHDWDAPIGPGKEIALIPPVSGG